MDPCFSLVGNEALSCSTAATVVLQLTFMNRVQLNSLLLAKRTWLITHALSNVSWHLKCVRTEGIYWPL